MQKQSKRDEYVEKLKTKLDEWNGDIDKLVARAQDVAAMTRKEYEEQIGRLQARRRDLEVQLHHLGAAAETAWEDMRSGVDAAAEALGTALKSAKGRFSSPSSEKRGETDRHSSRGE